MRSATKMTMRVRGPGSASDCPHAASNDITGTARPFQCTVPRYHGGAPSISSGGCKSMTSATQARGTISRSCASGTSRL